MSAPARDPAAPVAIIIVNWNGAADTLEVLRELEANEFRAGEFYQTLADRYDVSAWSVRMMAVSAKRAREAS